MIQSRKIIEEPKKKKKRFDTVNEVSQEKALPKVGTGLSSGCYKMVMMLPAIFN